MGPSGTNREDIIILSIRPEFADQIYAHEKAFELRKPGIPTELSYILLLEAGGRKLTGGFAVGEVHEGSPEEIWSLVEGGPTPKERFDRYYQGHDKARAIEIRRPERLAEPVSEQRLGSICEDLNIPPRFSFLYAPDSLLSKLRPGLQGLDELLNETTGQTIGNWLGPSFRDIQPDEHDDFRKMVAQYIGERYDQIDPSFADHILRSHEAGEDPVGYFTKRKHVFSVEQNGDLVGYVVTTWKRGGSVKFGPTLIKEDHQQQGIAPQVRAKLNDRLRNKGVRKSYSTIPDDHPSAYKYLVRTGHMVEGHLSRHYSRDHGELVFGKLLRREKASETPDSPERDDRELTDIRPGIKDFDRFADFIVDRMDPWYDEIDREFAKSIYEAAERYPAEDLSEKPKMVFIGEGNGALLASAVCTIKRGRAAKVAPFLTSVRASSALPVLDAVEEWGRDQNLRKLYSLVPILDSGVYQAFRNRSYEVEAHLREPYKAGIDMVVLSKFLTPDKTEEG